MKFAGEDQFDLFGATDPKEVGTMKTSRTSTTRKGNAGFSIIIDR